MYHPQRLIALSYRIDNYPEGYFVIDLLKRDLLGNDLFIDGVKVFGAADYLALGQVDLGKFFP